jgi:ATP-dependent protease ClpP protease subunit
MLHDTYLEDTKGSPDQVKAFAEAEQLQSGRFATLLGRYTKKPKRFWMNLYRKRADVYFDAAQALEWGLIDGIWSEKD